VTQKYNVTAECDFKSQSGSYVQSTLCLSNEIVRVHFLVVLSIAVITVYSSRCRVSMR